MKKSNLDKLTQEDAQKLIIAEKNPDNIMDFNDVYNQITSSIVVLEAGIYRCTVCDYKSHIRYNMINRQTEKDDKFSICLILPNNIHLIRFDFGSEYEIKHKNNWNTSSEYYVKGSHVHILANPGKYERKNVIPIDKFDTFKNFKTMKEAFKKSINYLNIRRKP